MRFNQMSDRTLRRKPLVKIAFPVKLDLPWRYPKLLLELARELSFPDIAVHSSSPQVRLRELVEAIPPLHCLMQLS